MDADVRRHNVSVETRLSLENPKIVVDEIQIQQVLINLIRNALDAMADQSPSHRQLTVSTMQLEREQTAILVADSGPGISSDDVGRLFDAFFSTKPDGMGIGLSISRTIVEAHGGTIGVNSTEDAPVGASFQVTLPAAKASRPEPHFRRSIETSRTKLSTEDL